MEKVQGLYMFCLMIWDKDLKSQMSSLVSGDFPMDNFFSSSQMIHWRVHGVLFVGQSLLGGFATVFFICGWWLSPSLHGDTFVHVSPCTRFRSGLENLSRWTAVSEFGLICCWGSTDPDMCDFYFSFVFNFSLSSTPKWKTHCQLSQTHDCTFLLPRVV